MSKLEQKVTYNDEILTFVGDLARGTKVWRTANNQIILSDGGLNVIGKIVVETDNYGDICGIQLDKLGN